MTMYIKSFLISILLLSAAACIISCSASKENEALDKAESCMENHPDSALLILKEIDKTRLRSKSEQARYALLISIALDKNYIDTTNFNVLQPAIDYYLKNGTPDDKLRTYYYQGRIFQNKGDKDNALNSFVKGLDVAPHSKDSLCIARALVAQALLYKDFYDFNSYAESYLKAANIYKDKKLKDREFDCLLNGLNAAIILNDKGRADSLINICNNFSPLEDKQKRILQGYRLSHALVFGSENELKHSIENQENGLDYTPNGILNLAYAYNKLGDNIKAKQMIDYLDESGLKYDTLKYQSILVYILRDSGDYKEAFSLYWDFSHRLDSINAIKFEQKAKSIEEKHEIEIAAQNDSLRKNKIILCCLGGIVALSMGVLILVLLVHRKNIKKALSEHKVKAMQLENKILKGEKERLDLENKNLQLEMENKALEAENLAHRVETLEDESESLKNLLENHSEIPDEVRRAIRMRVDLLNSLLASFISDNDEYGKSYEALAKQLTENTNGFMNSNRLALQMSYPQFIRYFEEHGLTTEEINYVCLYAIGLRGKEVGNYMKKRSHINVSSAIRRKLGIDRHNTNIGIYVRKLLKSYTDME